MKILFYGCTYPLRLSLFMALLTLTACGGGGGSSYGGDVGDQDDNPPIASATVLGMGSSSAISNKQFIVRAGTEVVLSGKDSSGVDDPLLTFDWQQVDSSGVSVTLIERTANSKAFNAPLVSSNIELIFELTITDGDGVTASDRVTVTVLPVGDVNNFLSHPGNNPSILRLLAAPANGQTTGASSEAFTINIEVIAHWRNRDGDLDELSLRTDSVNGVFPANFTAGADPLADSENPILNYTLPQLDADDININFEDSQRYRRLEFFEINSAYLELQITLVPVSTTVTFSVFAIDSSNQLISANAIANNSIGGSGAITPAQASLLSTAGGQFSKALFVEEIKGALGIENISTARNYYQQIDPTGQFVRLQDWLEYAGFVDSDGNRINDPAIAHTTYVNNYDLGFGRDMWVKKAANGNVYSYVVNYPSLELALQGRNDFAVVVMEYSENPDPAGINDKIVKFLSYVPDERNGGYIRANTMNFDGRGERPVPGVCTACHYQGTPIARDFTDVADADLGATFLPWDLDAFLYSDAADTALIDPAFNINNVPANQRRDVSRETQEPAFKQMNEAVISTYLADPGRHDTSIRLLHCMYGDADFTAPTAQLPAATFDSDCVQSGWASQPTLYKNVFAKYCRACHSQFTDPISDFDDYDDFITTPSLQNYVFEQGLMPLARLTMDRFWVDFNGGTSASDQLRAHLNGIGQTISTTPGQPVPSISLSTASVDSIGEKIILDASNSLFTDSFNWSLNSNCGSSPTVFDSQTDKASFTVNASPCTYTVSLAASNQFSTVSKDANVTSDRAPATVSFTAPLTDGYTKGSTSLLVDILSQITQTGDGNLDVVINDNTPRFALNINSNVTNNNNGTLNVAISALSGTTDSFEYQLEDADGSVAATKGVVTLSIPALAATVVADTPTASSVELSWTVPTGLAADSFDIVEDTNDIAEITGLTGSTFTKDITGLGTNTNYTFYVRTNKNGDSSSSNQVSISTDSGVPQSFMQSTTTATSIKVTWDNNPTDPPSSYKVYRDLAMGELHETANGNTLEFTDSPLTPNTTYQYEVSAIYGMSETSKAGPLSATTNTEAPTLSLADTPNITTSSVDLKWSDSNGGSISYKIYINDSEEASGVTSPYTLNSLPSGVTTNNITVRATGINGESVNSNALSVTTLVSYANNIQTQVVDAYGCATSCHTGATLNDRNATLKGYITANSSTTNPPTTCLNDNLNIDDCSISMTSVVITEAQRLLLEQWGLDNKQD